MGGKSGVLSNGGAATLKEERKDSLKRINVCSTFHLPSVCLGAEQKTLGKNAGEMTTVEGGHVCRFSKA